MTSIRQFPPMAPGVWCMLPTPFDATGARPDLDSLRGIVGHWAATGASGAVALGAIGEPATLTPGEQAEVVAAATDLAGFPVFAATLSVDTAEAVSTVERLHRAAGDRLAGVMVAVSSPDPTAVVDHVGRVHEATGLPVLRQDYPASTGVTIAIEDLAAAVDDARCIVGVKAESPPSVWRVRSLAALLQRPVSIFGGLGGALLPDELEAGAVGAMSGNSFPEPLVETVELWQAGRHEAAFAQLAPWLSMIGFEFQPIISVAVRKWLLHRRGLLRHPTVRPGGAPFPPELAALAAAHLRRAERELARR